MFAIPVGEGAELRPLEPWNAEEFLEHIDRAREFAGPWVPMTVKVTDLDSARQVLQRYADKQAADTGRLYGVWLDGTLVGGVFFRVFDIETDSCEVGVWLQPSATGRGLVTAAARVLIDWAVDQRGMHRVEWLVSSLNDPSKAVAKRLGLVRDGVLRESFPWQGIRHDMEVWSVLAPEWRAARAAR
ncbi:GNAT family N-acetyltransferase [Streptomyces spectabilis]|uniref:N-acetyltransferase n=1 Tax=Streptomyces spectabilis TaxID=68270 RepID=A0A5P2XG86_STRST|nr:GNAT family protein [Streptomyces spectabilis]MBB5104319.1 RimJ/RimL family protein N-acetyltransferase [Streptomyces spectabilis]MCI3905322.1 GNAT family N-acetyltransferase [Streptomyces spectabilis]QEV62319.1 N-acetyltransferase [Streptomyces spectabilis]GGU99202.1 N-acetyltransferase [Streptomyces spectabilis]